ncbi:MAG: alpha/beta hydrolase [Actinomyces sp.]|nr:alpha/beta hydrolase [Actinomyces sp.]
MTVSWGHVLTWETGPLESIASDLLEASKGLREAYESGDAAVWSVRSQGEAVTTMQATTICNLASLDRALTNINGALMAIEAARDGVGSIMADINKAKAFASLHGCTINNIDGSVSAVNQYKKAVTTLEDNVHAILAKANQVDTTLAEALASINTDRYTDGDRGSDKVVGIPDVPQPNWSPSQNAAWWNSLPEERKKFLIDHCPDDIRHLDGLPAAARDQANRRALDGYVDANGKEHQGALRDAKRAVEEAQQAYDIADKKCANDKASDHVAAEAEKADAQIKLDRAKEAYEDLKAIREQTANDVRASKGLAPAYLLDFNYDNDYHRTTAIVSSGNPDTATHVSTLVPGIGTNVRGDLVKYVAANDRLRAQTAHAGVDPNSVATISYLGYVAPRNDGLNNIQAADIGYANRAAPVLARFEEGLRANAEANHHKFTNTLVTHSYGSTTGGKAAILMAPGTVDRLILTGSPGGGVQSIDEYNVPREHVYESSIPEGDAVQGIGPDWIYGKNPRKLEGITHLSGDATDAKDYWHPLPPETPLIGDPAAGVRTGAALRHAIDNHMLYFEDGTRTSQDFANIIAGGNPTTDEEWAAIKAARAKENNGH